MLTQIPGNFQVLDLTKILAIEREDDLNPDPGEPRTYSVMITHLLEKGETDVMICDYHSQQEADGVASQLLHDSNQAVKAKNTAALIDIPGFPALSCHPNDVRLIWLARTGDNRWLIHLKIQDLSGVHSEYIDDKDEAVTLAQSILTIIRNGQLAVSGFSPLPETVDPV